MNDHIDDRVRLSDIHKSSEIEMIFSKKEHDTKKINNRSEKKIPSKMIDAIEQGVTSEQLDSFKVPIFKYGTQITIHGIFPDLDNMLRVGGYKRIFQNKNKSVGVKYEAIDNSKKKRIYRAFVHVHGFRTENNSKEYCAYRNVRCKDKDEVLAKIEEYKPLFDKINLRFGTKQLYYARVKLFGSILHYMVFTVHIDAIYEKDIPKFCLDVFGKTEAVIDAEIKLQEEQEAAEREEKHQKWEEEQAVKKEKQQAMLTAELDRLSKLGVNVSQNIPVTDGLVLLKIDASTDYTTKEQYLEYHILHFYKPPRARMFSYHKSYFEAYDVAMKHAADKATSHNDYKFRKETTSGIILSQ